MSRKKKTPEAARARVGDLFMAFGWDKEKRRAWLDEHMELSPTELLKAAEAAVDKDHTVWRDMERKRGPAPSKTPAVNDETGEQGNK